MLAKSNSLHTIPRYVHWLIGYLVPEANISLSSCELRSAHVAVGHVSVQGCLKLCAIITTCKALDHLIFDEEAARLGPFIIQSEEPCLYCLFFSLSFVGLPRFPQYLGHQGGLGRLWRAWSTNLLVYDVGFESPV